MTVKFGLRLKSKENLSHRLQFSVTPNLKSR